MCSATQRCVLRLLLAVLWLGAVHHCAFEGLVRGLVQTTAHQAADYDGEGCPSHAGGDTSSHEEGSPCIASFTLNESAVHLASPPLSVFADLVGRIESLDPSIRPDRHALMPVDLERESRTSPVATLSHSLALAPNAPPRVA